MAYTWVQNIAVGSIIDAIDLNEIETAANETINYTCSSHFSTVKSGHYVNNSNNGVSANHTYNSSHDGDDSDWRYS